MAVIRSVRPCDGSSILIINHRTDWSHGNAFDLSGTLAILRFFCSFPQGKCQDDMSVRS
jgi:hypothetical protein